MKWKAVMSNIPKGYKQTEVGVIPSDWKVKPLSQLVHFTNGKAHESNIKDDGKFIVVNSKFISSEGKVVKFSDDSFCPTEAENILMVMSDVPNGKAIAKCFFVDKDNCYTVNQRICSLKVKTDNPKFLFFIINRNKYYLSFDDGVKQTNLRRDDVLRRSIPLPAIKAEQTAIAAALSDADALIISLEKLIAKKRNIKQGAMQELLTGKKRLPGFSGRWEVKKLGEVADIVSGGTPSTNRKEFWDGDIFWCTPTDITALCGSKYLIDTARKISPLGLKNCSAEVLPKNSIVMTTRATIGECAINKISVSTNQGFKSFIPKEEINAEFLYYKLLTQKPKFVQLGSGSTFFEVSKKDIKDFQIPLPATKSEQTAIATILSDMDAEIEQLEQKLDKYKMIKQGMMQELLTGKIRLNYDSCDYNDCHD